MAKAKKAVEEKKTPTKPKSNVSYRSKKLSAEQEKLLLQAIDTESIEVLSWREEPGELIVVWQDATRSQKTRIPIK